MKPHVTVVGAGWAGLSCALELSQRGHPVTLLESAPQAGGRARSLLAPRQQLDNGQHLLLGAYETVLRLMRQCGTELNKAFLRTPLHIWQYDDQGRSGFAALGWLPAPLHLLLPLLRFAGLTLRQRLRLIRFMLWCQIRGFRLPQDQALGALLQQHAQDARTIQLLWEPLCLAALNTPIAEASAQLFLNTLRDSVASSRRKHSEMLIPRLPLHELFVAPALTTLQQRGCEVRLRCRVSRLILADKGVTAVELEDGVQLGVDQLVLATPPHITARLLAPHSQLAQLGQQIGNIDSYPVTTVYLQYPATGRLAAPMLGLLDGPGQWLFDLSYIDQPGRMAMSISGPGPHMDMDSDRLGQAVAEQIARQFPHLPAVQEWMVIREKRATFAARVGVQNQRPQSRTPCTNLWLAADYVQHDYPATLEAAAQIGVQCARLIAQQSEA